MDSPSSPSFVARRSSPRLAKKLKDTAEETLKSKGSDMSLVPPQSQETEPESLTFHSSQIINDVIGNMLSKMYSKVSPIPVISPASPSRLMPAKRGKPIETLMESVVQTGLILKTNFLDAEPSTPDLEFPNQANASTKCDIADPLRDTSTAMLKEGPRESSHNLSRTQSLNLTEMAAMCVGDDFSEDEVESDPSLVSVRGYNVKEDSAALLEAIFVKYGDIATQCSLSRMEWRSRFLEAVCDIFQSLKETDFVQITPEEIEQKIEIVCDIEKLNRQVRWLRQRLSDILEARQLVRQSSKLKEDKDRNAEFINAAEQKLKEYKLEMVALEENLLALKEKIKTIECQLVSAKDNAERINSKHSNAKIKVKRFYKQSLVDGLL